MTSTPAGNEPHRPAPAERTLAPTAPGKPHLHLTRPKKILAAVVGIGVLTIATLGFIGSYTAVSNLALNKGFGDFSRAFPIGIDAGIVAFLALDLLLTWFRIGFPLLRYGAWTLTAATIAFNAAAAWPDPLGASMHAVIPALFVIAVEAGRHAIGRIADITADKHLEGPPISCWFLKPIGTFILWRRQRLWAIRTWDTVLGLERERRIYVAQLRKDHGRAWRRKASAAQMLVLSLAKDGMSVKDAIALPEQEAQKLAEDEANRQAEARAKTEAEAEAHREAEVRAAEAEAKKRTAIAEAEAAEARAKSEAETAAEVAHLEVEAKRRAEAEAARIGQAETEAKLAQIAREQQQAETEAAWKQQQRQAETQAAARRQAADEARARKEQEARERAESIARTASATSSTTPKPATSTARTSTSVSPIGGPRAKKQTEVEKVLARMVEANDPEAVSLKWIQEHFDLKQTTAYDRLKTAQDLFAKAQEAKSA